jgi:16S rRNA (cytosine967-C5)-methyltransferase
VEEGSFLDETIDNYFSNHNLSDKEKGLIYQITSGVIRWKGYLDWVLSSYAHHEIKKDLRYLLWTGLYQIAFMKKADYHVVNEIVDYVKKEKGKAPANFVNAILRRYLRENGVKKGIPEEALKHSFPEWLVKRWQDRFGKADTEELLLSLNENPQFSVRVNLDQISLSDAISRLHEEGIKTKEGLLSESALSVQKLGPVLKSRLFSEGLISIQDEMSQLVGLAIGTQKGTRILDACAGLGTKTHQIRELCPDATLVSMDNEIKRLKSITNTGLTVLGDAIQNPFKRGIFDTILVDAPCSSLGILRKHPEIKWRRRQRDIISFGNFQFALLKALWDNLARGGHMIYSVCSFEPDETVAVIEKFKKEKQFILVNPLPFLFNKEYFLSLPHETGADGFFIAKMKKI